MNKQEKMERNNLIVSKYFEYSKQYHDWSRRIQEELGISKDTVRRALLKDSRIIAKKSFSKINKKDKVQIQKDKVKRELLNEGLSYYETNKELKLLSLPLDEQIDERIRLTIPYQSKDKKMRRPKEVTQDVLDYIGNILNIYGYDVVKRKISEDNLFD